MSRLWFVLHGNILLVEIGVSRQSGRGGSAGEQTLYFSLMPVSK